MNKRTIDTIIRNMQHAGIVTKAAPWMVEGKGMKELNVRYVGIKPTDEWRDILSAENNVLIKFSFDKQTSVVEYFLANKPPFVRITGVNLGITDKWETLLGELRRQLKKDKDAIQHHTDRVGNLYKLIVPHLK